MSWLTLTEPSSCVVEGSRASLCGAGPSSSWDATPTMGAAELVLKEDLSFFQKVASSKEAHRFSFSWVNKSHSERRNPTKNSTPFLCSANTPGCARKVMLFLWLNRNRVLLFISKEIVLLNNTRAVRQTQCHVFNVTPLASVRQLPFTRVTLTDFL